MKRKKQTATNQPVDLVMTYWEEDDGSIAAKIDGINDVYLYANTETLYITFVPWLIETMGEQMQAGKAAGLTQGAFDIKMTADWIEGAFCVRFDDWRGVGIQAPSPERFKAFLFALGKVASKRLAPMI